MQLSVSHYSRSRSNSPSVEEEGNINKVQLFSSKKSCTSEIYQESRNENFKKIEIKGSSNSKSGIHKSSIFCPILQDQSANFLTLPCKHSFDKSAFKEFSQENHKSACFCPVCKSKHGVTSQEELSPQRNTLSEAQKCLIEKYTREMPDYYFNASIPQNIKLLKDPQNMTKKCLGILKNLTFLKDGIREKYDSPTELDKFCRCIFNQFVNNFIVDIQRSVEETLFPFLKAKIGSKSSEMDICNDIIFATNQYIYNQTFKSFESLYTDFKQAMYTILKSSI